jgi:hypothetical protein
MIDAHIMPRFALNDISQYKNPRWPVLSSDDSLALLGYAYGRSHIHDAFVTSETVERRSDLLMAVFCCGGSLEQIGPAIIDYISCVQKFLRQAPSDLRHVRKAIIYTQDALLLSLAYRRQQVDVHSIGASASILLDAATSASQADLELTLGLRVILACLDWASLPCLPAPEPAISQLLQGAITNDTDAFREGLRDRFAATFRFQAIDKAAPKSGNLLEKVSDYWRFGRGLVYVGYFGVARRLNMDMGDLRNAMEVKPYYQVFDPL